MTAASRLQTALDDFDRENADDIANDDFNVGQDEHIEVSAADLRAMLTEAREEAKPVAWRFRDHPNNGWVYTGLGDRHGGCEVQPLYTTPPSQPLAEGAEAEKLRGALKHYACSCEPGHCAMSDDDTDTPVDYVLCGRRAAEALAASQIEVAP